jgi:hypothetical protein
VAHDGDDDDDDSVLLLLPLGPQASPLDARRAESMAKKKKSSLRLLSLKESEKKFEFCPLGRCRPRASF